MADLRKHLATALATRYTIERELGHGGMACVYLAQDLQHRRPVAIKVFRPELTAALGVERFLREIEIASRLHHPHILPLLESGEADGLLYYVMPYVAGDSLRERLIRERQLPLSDAFAIARQVADGLQSAHGQGLVHRDIKPENILLADAGAMVADFGIARAITVAGGEQLTSTGVVVGTPAYMSPEQAAGEPHLDGRSDVFSLGCVVYEMLAGTPPFVGSTAQAIQARRTTDPVPPLRTVRKAVPVAVETTIERALAKVPADRFATPLEFTAALTTPRSVSRHARRGGVVVAMVAVTVIAMSAARLVVAHRVVPPAPDSVIAVMPFVASEPDTALTRLGRDLAFTVGAELDGVGDIRAVFPPTVLASSDEPGVPYSIADAALQGRRLRAGKVLCGTLVKYGSRVQLDLQLLRTSTAAPLGHVTITNAAESTAALTDSVALRVLRQLWERGGAPMTNPSALTTRSIAALRAFLDGDHAMADGRWGDADLAFARASEADPTFWLARWRRIYVRSLQGSPLDIGEVRALWAHRVQVHGVDSLLLAAAQESQLRARVSLSSEATRQYPFSWWAWFFHAEGLSHYGARLGYDLRDSRAEYERAVALNPRFVDGWSHLLLVTIGQDSNASTRAFEAYRQLSPDPVRVRRWRLLAELDRNGGLLDTALADSVFHDGGSVYWSSHMSALFTEFGFPATQVAVDRRALRQAIPAPYAWLYMFSLGQSWAARGAWDSAVVAADAFATTFNGDSTILDSYRMAVIGAWLNALDPGPVRQRQRTLAAVRARLSATDRAELAWLDGMLAVRLRDPSGLATARALLPVSGDSDWQMLDRSLAAFAQAFVDRRRAGQSLAAFEWQRPYPNDGPNPQGLTGILAHPYLTGVNRLAAAAWLLEGGDTSQAASLLTWHENRMWHSEVTLADAALSGPAYLQLAHIEETRGHVDRARQYYQQFLRRYDLPVPAQRKMVDDARLALAKLPD